MSSLNDLRNRNIRPQATVFVETEKNKVEEFTTFTAISTQIFLEAINTATITFDNNNLKHLYSEDGRFLRDPIIRNRSLEEIDYLARVLKIAKIKALNKEFKALLEKFVTVNDRKKIVDLFIILRL